MEPQNNGEDSEFKNAIVSVYESTKARVNDVFNYVLNNLYDDRVYPDIYIEFVIQLSYSLLVLDDNGLTEVYKVSTPNQLGYNTELFEDQVKLWAEKVITSYPDVKVVLCSIEDLLSNTKDGNPYGIDMKNDRIFVFALIYHDSSTFPLLLHYHMEHLCSYLRASRADRDGKRKDISSHKEMYRDAIFFNAINDMENHLFTDESNRIELGAISLISSEYYESKVGRGQICLVESPLICDVHLYAPFYLNNQNTRKVRKMLEIAKNDLALIVYKQKVIGISRVKGIGERRYMFRITGHMQWEFFINGALCFQYKHGVYKIPAQENYHNIINDMLFEFYNVTNERARNIISLITGIKDNGTIVVVGSSGDIIKEVDRLCSLDRGTKIDSISLTAMPQLVNSIISIDGAIFIDVDCNCYAIGVILDGESIIQGNSSRGARYNSGRNYAMLRQCSLKDGELPFIAIIISEDGSIDVFPQETI